ncbi:hypothetical protein Rm378p057 [Rhodothermus phage RM378]|uniref:hypothetical protein n=1 Tax=Rhodothermus phage RM378 TaxID=148943 RepID=UPI000018F642|nr:hypothetical protein Rm378p057 [Rhodothermus phage RM378]
MRVVEKIRDHYVPSDYRSFIRLGNYTWFYLFYHDTHDIPLTPAHNTFPQTFAAMQTLTVKCKLVLSKEQREALDTTMRAFAAACNDAIAVGRRLNTASNIRIHRVCYSDLRARHGLTANLAVRAIARAAGILKVKKRQCSTVRPTSIDYDARIFSFREANKRRGLEDAARRLLHRYPH